MTPTETQVRSMVLHVSLNTGDRPTLGAITTSVGDIKDLVHVGYLYANADRIRGRGRTALVRLDTNATSVAKRCIIHDIAVGSLHVTLTNLAGAGSGIIAMYASYLQIMKLRLGNTKLEFEIEKMKFEALKSSLEAEKLKLEVDELRIHESFVRHDMEERLLDGLGVREIIDEDSTRHPRLRRLPRVISNAVRALSAASDIRAEY